MSVSNLSNLTRADQEGENEFICHVCEERRWFPHNSSFSISSSSTKSMTSELISMENHA